MSALDDMFIEAKSTLGSVEFTPSQELSYDNLLNCATAWRDAARQQAQRIEDMKEDARVAHGEQQRLEKRTEELETALRPFCGDRISGLFAAGDGLFECYWCHNLQGGPAGDFVHDVECEIETARAALGKED